MGTNIEVLETKFRVIQQEQAGLDAPWRDAEMLYLIGELDDLIADCKDDANENLERDFFIHLLFSRLEKMYHGDVAGEDTCVFA